MAAGVMNLFWIAGLAFLILLGKTIPMGHWSARIAGVRFAAWGTLMIIGRQPVIGDRLGDS
jgi:predicted metal-binding membrane protein